MPPPAPRIMAAVPASPGAVGFITINVDPVLHLGPLPIHWYGVMYVVGIMGGLRRLGTALSARKSGGASR